MTRTLEEEVMDTTTVMSKEMDAWMKKGDGWMAIVLGKMHNAVMVPMILFPYKIHYMHRVDDRKMEHAAKTR